MNLVDAFPIVAWFVGLCMVAALLWLLIKLWNPCAFGHDREFVPSTGKWMFWPAWKCRLCPARFDGWTLPEAPPAPKPKSESRVRLDLARAFVAASGEYACAHSLYAGMEAAAVFRRAMRQPPPTSINEDR